MKKTFYLPLLLMFLSVFVTLHAQPAYTADDVVTPYTGQFRTGLNMGYFPGWDNYKLANIAAGNPAIGQKGVGARALRFSTPENILDFYGYNLLVPEIAHYGSLNTDEHTALIWGPTGAHQDLNQYCPGKPSALFSNMYLPIWDGGLNGTPYNDNNYLAAYIYKTVTIYKDDIRFWEVWNEPGLDLRYDIGGIGWRDQNYPGNWWAEGPQPCDYILHAPVYHYIRTLRISYEIIKTVDPTAYVCLGSVGYQSLLNAICNNTDNPNMGDVSADFPKKGGAYFDAVSFHSYPHFDGATTNYNAQFFERHSDQAADGVITYRQLYQQILDQYGYNGVSKPRKEWIITEINSPRKVFGLAFGGAPQLGPFFGGVDAQINHIMKALMISKVSGIHQTQIYELFDRQSDVNAGYEFDLMGMYKVEGGAGPYNITVNDEGIAVKTTSDFLNNTTYDAVRTAQLGLPGAVRGYAFKRPDGSYVYAMWARTTEDLSENAFATYSFPSSLNLPQLQKYDWNYGYSGTTSLVSSQGINLNARPTFFTAPGSTQPCAVTAQTNEVLCNNNGTPTNPADDTYSFTLTVNGGGASGWTSTVNGVIVNGSYGAPITVGPIPITNNTPLSIIIRDVSNNACTATATVTPPPSCSTATNCQLGAVVSNKQCNNNGTPTDPSDDTFTFSVVINPSGTTCGTGWFGGNATAAYGVSQNFGPFPIANGNVFMAFQDNANATISTSVTVTPPAPCSAAPNCQIAATVTNKVCNNNGTPSNPADDTFTFSVTINPTGTTCGTGWFSGATAQTYGAAQNYGPYPIANGNVFIAFQDNANNTITTTVTVTPPATCSNTPLACDAASNSSSREWIGKIIAGAMTNITGAATYTDYSATKTVSGAAGTIVPITLTTNYTFFTFDEYYRIWIDLNKDGAYTANEKVYEGILTRPANGTATKTLTGALSIPANTPLGTTRMRVAMSRGSYANPCQNFPRGEVEDYGFNVITLAEQTANRSKGIGALSTQMESDLIAVYPNPTQGKLVLDLKDWMYYAAQSDATTSEKIAQVYVYNQIGALVHTAEFFLSEHTFLEMDLSHLGQGNYHVRIESAGYMPATKRIQVVGKK
jgi:GEVED domain/Secretion system C-terminal sorting domain